MASLEKNDLSPELSNEIKKYLSNPSNAEAAAEAVLNDLIDTVILGYVFEVHRAAKIGLVDIDINSAEEVNSFDIVEGSDGHIFGNHSVKKVPNPVCPSCKRSKGASAFAKHVAKCMRLSSRKFMDSKYGK